VGRTKCWLCCVRCSVLVCSSSRQALVLRVSGGTKKTPATPGPLQDNATATVTVRGQQRGYPSCACSAHPARELGSQGGRGAFWSRRCGMVDWASFMGPDNRALIESPRVRADQNPSIDTAHDPVPWSIAPCSRLTVQAKHVARSWSCRDAMIALHWGPLGAPMALEAAGRVVQRERDGGRSGLPLGTEPWRDVRPPIFAWLWSVSLVTSPTLFPTAAWQWSWAARRRVGGVADY
jgi:hypothetical protein